jgi:hypothetical protein
MEFAENDWKELRRLHATAFERFCARTLQECAALAADDAVSAGERYGALQRYMKERDRIIAAAFKDLRRPRALEVLGGIAALDLLTEDELGALSAGVRDRLVQATAT